MKPSPLIAVEFVLLAVASASYLPCTGVCKNGGECMEGPSFDPESTYFVDEGGELITGIGDETSTTNSASYYCLCQEGWSGRDCSQTVAHCGHDAGGREYHCFHGGLCVQPGLRSLPTCDCASAMDNYTGNTYEGKHCETVVSAPESCHSDTSYCLNGGQCSLDAQMKPVCSCSDKYDGIRCQLQITAAVNPEVAPAQQRKPPNDTNLSGAASGCLLQCQNGGECAHGSRQATEIELSILGLQNKDVNSEGMHCSCSLGHYGLLCDKAHDDWKAVDSDESVSEVLEARIETMETTIIVLSVLLTLTVSILVAIVLATVRTLKTRKKTLQRDTERKKILQCDTNLNYLAALKEQNLDEKRPSFVQSKNTPLASGLGPAPDMFPPKLQEEAFSICSEKAEKSFAADDSFIPNSSDLL